VDKTLIIAEAGINHNGSLGQAIKLCDAARKARADIVKFQTFRTECNVLKDCDWVKYQKENAPDFKSHWEMLKALELDDDEFRELKAYCDKTGIGFLSTPSDQPSLELLLSMGVGSFKISSGDVANIPLLRKIGRLNKIIWLSTGMSTMEEVGVALKTLTQAGTSKEKITLLHCHSDYPTKIEDANLSAMLALRDAFGTKVGFSDHTLGTEAAIAAVALGASVIEKHLTLDRNMAGPDQKSSLEPEIFASMVKAVRNIEKAMGDGVKRITPKEQEIRRVYGKGIVAARDIAKGEIFTEDKLAAKRPNRGIAVSEWDMIVGRTAKNNFKKDDFIKL